MASRNIILHNFGWKMLSLALAALTWLTIETKFQRNAKSAEESKQAPLTTTSKRTFPAPITLLASPLNTNHYKVSPEIVSVDVGGEEQELKLLQLREVQAFVDLSDVQDEKQLSRPIQVRIPKGFSLVTNDPVNASVERITPAR